MRFSLRQREPLRPKTSSCRIEIRNVRKPAALMVGALENDAPDRFAIGVPKKCLTSIC
jgi:hypothetical protein